MNGIGGLNYVARDMYRGPRGVGSYKPYVRRFQAGGAVTGDNLVEIATQIALEEGVPPDLFLRLIGAESSGNQSAVSPKGALGLTQLMPATAKELGVDPTDPIDNMRGGARYLKIQLDRFDNNPVLALAAYNAGPGAVDEYGGVPPFRETMDYVNKILGPDYNTREFYSDFARFVDEGAPLPPPERTRLEGEAPRPVPRPAAPVPMPPAPVPRPTAIEPVAAPEMAVASMPADRGSRPTGGIMDLAYTGAPVYESVSEIPSVSAPAAARFGTVGSISRRNTR